MELDDSTGALVASLVASLVAANPGCTVVDGCEISDGVVVGADSSTLATTAVG